MMMLSRISFVCAALVAIVAVACDTMPLTAPSGSALTISAGSTLVPTGGTTEIRVGRQYKTAPRSNFRPILVAWIRSTH